MKDRKHSGSRDLKHRPISGRATPVRRAVEIAVRRLNQAGHGTGSVHINVVGSAIHTETMEESKDAGRRDLEHAPITVLAAIQGGAIEVAIGALNQTGRRICPFAMPVKL